jgi:uncharacterized protein YdeI (YjbR/CyaY-like superfamily)
MPGKAESTSSINDAPEIHPKSRKEWRQWLQKNHNKEQAVWVVYYKKSSATPSMQWSEAVDEALCFGWIDGRRRPIDEETFVQYFSKRKRGGTWSKINKEKVERLIAEGLMMAAGLEVIAAAKKDGSWNILDSVEALEVPADLEAAFSKNAAARKFYDGLSKSVKKRVLHWLVMAKKEETRKKLVNDIVASAAEGKLLK